MAVKFQLKMGKLGVRQLTLSSFLLKSHVHHMVHLVCKGVSDIKVQKVANNK